MANPDLTDQAARKTIIDAIKSPQNVTRKLNEQRKFDIYRKLLRTYVIARLRDEFDPDTVNLMRKVTSINPTKRIVDEQASLYVDEPRRHWNDASKQEAAQLDAIYRYGQINPQMRLANRLFKLHGQSALYCLPRLGKLTARALSPKDYDVVPDEDDPERAFAYVLNVVDPALNRQQDITRAEASERRYDTAGLGNNSPIADDLDAQALAARYVWWSDDYHFTTDGQGNFIFETPDFDQDADDTQSIENPIGRLPFVDIATEKNFRFFVEMGSDVVDWTIDLAVQLSDLAQTAKFQSYSQAIIASTEEPAKMNVGPNRVLWLRLDPNAENSARPDFKFESPSPDLAGHLEVINTEMKLFLTSQGLSPSTVTGANEVEKFTSGIDHLLANLDKFKATREDMDLFHHVEEDLLEVLVAWQNVMFDVSDDEALDDVFRQTRLSDSPTLDLVFHEPEAIQTDTETLTYVTTAIESGLMTKLEGIKRVYKVDDDTAQEIFDTLEEEQSKKDQAEELAVAEDIKGRAVLQQDNGAQAPVPPLLKPDPASQPGGFGT